MMIKNRLRTVYRKEMKINGDIIMIMDLIMYIDLHISNMNIMPIGLIFLFGFMIISGWSFFVKNGRGYINTQRVCHAEID